MLIVTKTGMQYIISILAKFTSMGQNEPPVFANSQFNIIVSGYLGLRYNIKMIIKCHN